MTTGIDRYAVMGNPIVHSKSPQIHARFAAQTGQQLTYEAILVEPGQLATAVAEFRAAGGKGLNITVPFKLDAWELADNRSSRADTAGSVNTLHWKDDNTLFGDNTDGAGLVRDLAANHNIKLEKKNILLLGAGGAARGVLQPLLEQNPIKLFIANRTAEKAVALAARFLDYGPVSGGGFDTLKGHAYDIIINATAAGLSDEVPPVPDDCLGPHGVCYDTMYASEPTAFVRWGRAHNASVSVDGLGMLVEQAAESFFLWRGVRPETGPVIDALR
jgi:shikimate dehydrogenase